MRWSCTNISVLSLISYPDNYIETAGLSDFLFLSSQWRNGLCILPQYDAHDPRFSSSSTKVMKVPCEYCDSLPTILLDYISFDDTTLLLNRLSHAGWIPRKYAPIGLRTLLGFLGRNHIFWFGPVTGGGDASVMGT